MRDPLVIHLHPILVFTMATAGRFLIRGGQAGQEPESFPETVETVPLLFSDVPLSFWGGICYETSTVVDSLHPLKGQSVKDKILVLPGTRGSCTGSQVLLELILRGIAPRALVLRDADHLACVGGT